jgi:N-acetyl-gamma-glutamyl-phosphate reductase
MSETSIHKKKYNNPPLEPAPNSLRGDGGKAGPRLRAGIIGGAGYTGGELIRLLINHPKVEISFVHSKSNAGKPVSSVHQDLIGETDLKFTDDNNFNERLLNSTGGPVPTLREGWEEAVLFLCLGHGDSKKFLLENDISSTIKIIDLANDFRLKKDAGFLLQVTGNQQPATRNFIYGLPELNREQIKSANNIANPGCFATAIQLGLLPLAKAGLLNEVYTTGITGSTGAGQSLTPTSHFSWRSNNIQAYKTLTHQHLDEVHQSLHQLQASFPLSTRGEGLGVRFVPWRGDFTRGIFASSTIHCEETAEALKTLYNDFYAGHPFTIMSNDAVFLKQVVNTNKCVIQLEKVGSKLVIHSALDNLLKGASGQAVQNMNLMFDLDETTGLKLKSTYF